MKKSLSLAVLFVLFYLVSTGRTMYNSMSLEATAEVVDRGTPAVPVAGAFDVTASAFFN